MKPNRIMLPRLTFETTGLASPPPPDHPGEGNWGTRPRPVGQGAPAQSRCMDLTLPRNCNGRGLCNGVMRVQGRWTVRHQVLLQISPLAGFCQHQKKRLYMYSCSTGAQHAVSAGDVDTNTHMGARSRNRETNTDICCRHRSERAHRNAEL